MKCLVVYYSLSGKTKIVADAIAQRLSADIEEIQDQKNRKSLWGKIMSGYDATKKKSTIIANCKFNPAYYDLVIIGTPFWACTMSCATRAWLQEYHNSLKKVAFFATMGGSGEVKTFQEMALLAKQDPLAAVAFTRKNIVKNNIEHKLQDFISKLLT